MEAGPDRWVLALTPPLAGMSPISVSAKLQFLLDHEHNPLPASITQNSMEEVDRCASIDRLHRSPTLGWNPSSDHLSFCDLENGPSLRFRGIFLKCIYLSGLSGHMWDICCVMWHLLLSAWTLVAACRLNYSAACGILAS